MKRGQTIFEELMAAVDRVSNLYPDVTEWELQALLRQVARKYRRPGDAAHANMVLAGHAEPPLLREFRSEAERNHQHVPGVTRLAAPPTARAEEEP